MTPCDRFCPFLACPECRWQGGVKRANSPESWENWGSKTAPGVASTNTEGLARSSGTSREGMAQMIATSAPARTPNGEVRCAR